MRACVGPFVNCGLRQTRVPHLSAVKLVENESQALHSKLALSSISLLSQAKGYDVIVSMRLKTKLTIEKPSSDTLPKSN